LFDDCSATEGRLEVVELGEAPQGDIECAREVARVVVDDDVGEDPAFGGFVDVGGVGRVEDSDDGGSRFGDDGGNEFEGVVAVEAEADEGDVGVM
jgi:hypothetical protein